MVRLLSDAFLWVKLQSPSCCTRHPQPGRHTGVLRMRPQEHPTPVLERDDMVYLVFFIESARLFVV